MLQRASLCLHCQLGTEQADGQSQKTWQSQHVTCSLVIGTATVFLFVRRRLWRDRSRLVSCCEWTSAQLDRAPVCCFAECVHFWQKIITISASIYAFATICWIHTNVYIRHLNLNNQPNISQLHFFSFLLQWAQEKICIHSRSFACHSWFGHLKQVTIIMCCVKMIYKTLTFCAPLRSLSFTPSMTAMPSTHIYPEKKEKQRLIAYVNTFLVEFYF